MTERVGDPWLKLHLSLWCRRRIRVRERNGILEDEANRQVRNATIYGRSCRSHLPRMLSRRGISSGRKHERRPYAPAKSGFRWIGPVRHDYIEQLHILEFGYRRTA